MAELDCKNYLFTKIDFSNYVEDLNFPSKRRSHSTSLRGDRLYIFGGYRNDSADNQLYVLHLGTWKWERLTTTGFIPERAYHSGDFVGNALYIIGGTCYRDEAHLQVYAINMETLACELVEATGDRKPPPRCGHRTVVIGKDILVFGGSTRDEYFNDLWRFDTEHKRWTLLETINPPAPRNSFSFSLVGDAVYLFGGQIPTMRHETNDFYKLNLHTLEWTALHKYVPVDEGEWTDESEDSESDDDSFSLDHDLLVNKDSNSNGNSIRNNNGHGDNKEGPSADASEEKRQKEKESKRTESQEEGKVVADAPLIPPARADHTAVVYNKTILIFGGFLGRRDYFRYQDIHVYDTEKERWQAITRSHGQTPPTGLSGHTATAYHDKMLIFAGITDGFKLTEGFYMVNIPQVELTLVQLCLKVIKEKNLYPVKIRRKPATTPDVSTMTGIVQTSENEERKDEEKMEVETEEKERDKEEVMEEDDPFTEMPQQQKGLIKLPMELEAMIYSMYMTDRPAAEEGGL